MQLIWDCHRMALFGPATKQGHNSAAWYGYPLLWGCSGNTRIHGLMQLGEIKTMWKHWINRLQTIDTKIHVLWGSPPAGKILSVVCTAFPLWLCFRVIGSSHLMCQRLQYTVSGCNMYGDLESSLFNWLPLPSPQTNQYIRNSIVFLLCVLFYFHLPETQVLYLCVLTSVSVSTRLEFPHAYLVRVCAAREFPPTAAFLAFCCFCSPLVKGVAVPGTLKWQ